MLDIPGFPWYGGKHGVRAIDRFRKAHFERGAQSIKMSSESVVRTEDMTLDEMARELTADDASYLRWWAASAVDSNLKFLCVAGTSAFALERTLMMLQFTHGVFNRFFYSCWGATFLSLTHMKKEPEAGRPFETRPNTERGTFEKRNGSGKGTAQRGTRSFCPRICAWWTRVVIWQLTRVLWNRSV